MLWSTLPKDIASRLKTVSVLNFYSPSSTGSRNDTDISISFVPTYTYLQCRARRELNTLKCEYYGKSTRKAVNETH